MPGPAPNSRRPPLFLGAIVVIVATAVAALYLSGRAARGDWRTLRARFESARPELEEAIRALVVDEFWRRLPERSDWRVEGGDAAGELVAQLAREHLEPVFEVVEIPLASNLVAADFALDLLCRLDFPLPAVGDRPVALVDALPNVRFVDLEVRLRGTRRGFAHGVRVEFVEAGAWLDGEVSELVRMALRGPGVEFVGAED